MKKRLFCAAIAAVILITALPTNAQASVKNSKIKLRSAYNSCKNKGRYDRVNYDNDRCDYVTPYDADTRKTTSKTGTSLTIHWYPISGAGGYEILDSKGKLVKRISGKNAKQATVSGLKENTRYTFCVRAYQKKGSKYIYSKKSDKATGRTGYLIQGSSTVSAAQMARFYKKRRSGYPSTFKKMGAPNIETFTQIVYNEAARYNIKAEVLFAQIMKETGYLKFGGDVSACQCNFGGIGAVGNGAKGVDFRTYAKKHYKAFGYNSASSAEKNAVAVGIRSQALHLALYAGAVKKINSSIDSRGEYVIIGNSPYVQWLGIKDNPYTTGEKLTPSGKSPVCGWAIGNNYGYQLVESIIIPLKMS